jgi:FkbM family methyltransferase
MSHPENVPRLLRWLNKAAQKGWIRFDQYSPLKRLAIVFYIVWKGLWRPMWRVTHPWKALWALLTGKDSYRLSLSGYAPQPLQMSPLNFLNFLRLYEAGYTPVAIDAEKNVLIIEMAPGVRYTAHVADTADLAPLKELLLEQEYGVSFRGYWILDVGGYRGETALFFCAHGAEKVIVAEPAPDNYALARQNIQQSPYQDRIELLPVGIADKSGMLSLRFDPRHPHAPSLDHLHGSSREGVPTISVEVWSFQQLVEHSGWPEVDLVKLDCEGAEYPILLNTPPEVLRRVRRWAIEYHGSPTPLQDRLRELGYAVRLVRNRGASGILHAERQQSA